MKKLVCAAATAAALLTVPAGAMAAKPAPCGPLAVEDAAGDQQLHVPQIGVPTGQDAAPLTDFTGFFLRADGSKVTGNLVIADLSKQVPEPASAIRWTLYYTVGDKAYYARTILYADGEISYLYGEDTGATLTQLGTMKGEFHEGKDGVISFVIPPAAGGKAGTQMTAANAIAAYQTDSGQGSSADFMPDGDDTFDATVPNCGTAPAPAPVEPGPGPAPAPAPAPVQPSQPGPAPSSPTPGATQADFRVGVKPNALRAAKVKKGKAITFTLTSGETLTGVTATLTKGKKTVGSGKLARMAGTGKLKLKPKAKLKKGSYTLIVTAKRADGSTGTVAVPVKVR